LAQRGISHFSFGLAAQSIAGVSKTKLGHPLVSLNRRPSLQVLESGPMLCFWVQSMHATGRASVAVGTVVQFVASACQPAANLCCNIGSLSSPTLLCTFCLLKHFAMPTCITMGRLSPWLLVGEVCKRWAIELSISWPRSLRTTTYCWCLVMSTFCGQDERECTGLFVRVGVAEAFYRLPKWLQTQGTAGLASPGKVRPCIQPESTKKDSLVSFAELTLSSSQCWQVQHMLQIW